MTDAEKAQTHILLVDDDKFLLNMYSKKFQESGFQVEAVPGTELALEKIRQGLTPDILLLDIILPKMTGIEFVAKVKEENLLPNATFIMLTNQSESTDIEKAKKLGVQGYIVKATSIPSEVVQEVIKIMDSHNAQ